VPVGLALGYTSGSTKSVLMFLTLIRRVSVRAGAVDGSIRGDFQLREYSFHVRKLQKVTRYVTVSHNEGDCY
jgi:hypothetical protein